MIASLLDDEYLVVRRMEAQPVHLEDFCDACGDCLDCFRDDRCRDGGRHSWCVYHYKTDDWLARHPDAAEVVS